MQKEKEILKKASEVDYVSFYREVKDGDIKPVYLIHGEERFLIERAVRFIREEVIKGVAEGSIYTFSGDELKIRDVLDLCDTVPLFESRKYVEIKRGEEMNKGDMELLGEYFKNPSTSTILVVWGINQKGGKGRSFPPSENIKNAVLKDGRGRVLYFPVKKRWEVRKFILTEVKRCNLKIEDRAVEYLIELTQGNLREISNIIERLQFFRLARSGIMVSDIEQLGVRASFSGLWGLQDALGARDLSHALFKFHEISRQGFESFEIIGVINSFFRKLGELKFRKRKGKPLTEIIRKVRLSPFLVETYSRYCNNFTDNELKEITRKVFSVQLKMRESKVPPLHLIESLIYEICRSG